MFAHTHSGAHKRDADRYFDWAWLIALVLAVLGIAFASAMERDVPRSAQVDRGD